MPGDADGAGGSGPSASEAAAAAKEAGNAALKSADLPLAIERYEEAVGLFDAALAEAPQPQVLRNNDLVHYGEGGFAIVDTAHPHFGDYVLQDLGTRSLVKVKVGRYEEVSRRFLRKELTLVPRHLFDLRLACLQNLALVSLKLARAARRSRDFEEAVRRADAALAMEGRSAKALMRKGAALVELGDVAGAAKALVAAAQETRGRDAEVQRLLELVLAAKGKGKGRGKGKGKGEDPGGGRGSGPGAAEDAGRGREGPEESESEGASEAEGAAPAGRAGAPAGAAAGPGARPGAAEGPGGGAPGPGAAAERRPGGAAAPRAGRAGAACKGPPAARPSKAAVAAATIAVAALGTAALLLRSYSGEGYDQEVEL